MGQKYTENLKETKLDTRHKGTKFYFIRSLRRHQYAVPVKSVVLSCFNTRIVSKSTVDNSSIV